LNEGGLEEDNASEITVVINAYKFQNGNNMLRQRTYRVGSHVKYGYGFVPMVKHPSLSRDGKPRVRWQLFHEILKASGMEKFPSAPEPMTSRNFQATSLAGPEDSNLERYFANFGKETFRVPNTDIITKELKSFLEHSQDEDTTMPAMPARHPTLSKRTFVDEVNDLSVGPSDLNRYAAAVGTDTLPSARPSFTVRMKTRCVH
jgi:hypothetical protein